VLTSGAVSAAVRLIEGGKVTFGITVTAENGDIRTYAVSVHRGASFDATLSVLTATSASLSSASSTRFYTMSVANAVASISFTATTAHASASSTLNGTMLVSGSASASQGLPSGSTVSFQIQVTAQDTTTIETYTVVLSRDPSTNCFLQAFVVSGGTINPAFLRPHENYALAVPNHVDHISVTPALDHPLASMTLNGAAASFPANMSLALGTTTAISITVTAQDGTSHKSYSLGVFRSFSADADLASLVANVGAFVPTFASAVNTYSMSVGNAQHSLTLLPTASHHGASVKVHGVSLASGSTSQALSLVEGAVTALMSEVMAQDNMTTKLYRVNVNRISIDARLRGLSFSPAAALVPPFDPGLFAYTMAVDNSVASTSVTHSLMHTAADVSYQVNGVALIRSTTMTLSLNEGANTTLEAIIVAEDPSHTRMYRMVIFRPLSSDATLLSLVPNRGDLRPAFSTFWLGNYTLFMGHGASAVSLVAAATKHDARVTMYNDTHQTSPLGQAAMIFNLLPHIANALEITVHAPDGVATHRFFVNVVLEQAPATAESDGVIMVATTGGGVALCLCLIGGLLAVAWLEPPFQELKEEMEDIVREPETPSPWDKDRILDRLRLARRVAEAAHMALKEAQAVRQALQEEHFRLEEHRKMQMAISSASFKSAQGRAAEASAKAQAARSAQQASQEMADFLEVKAMERERFARRAAEAFEKTTQHAAISDMLSKAETARIEAAALAAEADQAEHEAALAEAEAKKAESELSLAEESRQEEEEGAVDEEYAALRREIHLEARRAELRVVFRAFDLDQDGSLNENEFFEVGKVLTQAGSQAAPGGEAAAFAGFESSSAKSWSREESEKAWQSVVSKEALGDIASDFNNRECGTGRVATMEEFVEYFMERFAELPDASFDASVARFVVAAVAAKRFVQEAADGAQRRRQKMIAVFKGFDIDGGGEITLEEFRDVGQSLNAGQWSSRQNKALFRQMDKNEDGLVVQEEFLSFYRHVIYDIPDDQFARGLVDFELAVKRCWELRGIQVEFDIMGHHRTLSAPHASVCTVPSLERMDSRLTNEALVLNIAEAEDVPSFNAAPDDAGVAISVDEEGRGSGSDPGFNAAVGSGV